MSLKLNMGLFKEADVVSNALEDKTRGTFPRVRAEKGQDLTIRQEEYDRTGILKQCES